MRKPVCLFSVLLLTACTSAGPDQGWVAQIAASGFDESKAINLNGDPAKGQHYGIPNYETASALVTAHKGKAGSFVGYIWDVKVKDNKLALDIILTLSGKNAQLCTTRRQDLLDCLKSVRGFFYSSVTCHVNNLKQFYAAGGRRIGEDIPNKWQSAQHWNHVLVQGKISNVERKSVKFKRYIGGKSSLDFGDLGGSYNVGFGYNSVHLNDCRVFTFRGKAILPHS